MIILDVEGRERIEAYTYLHNGVYHIYSAYGVDESALREVIVRNALDIDYAIVDKYAIVEHLDDVLVGWNIAYDLRMIVKEYGDLLRFQELHYVDLYRDVLEKFGEHFTLWQYVYTHYGIRVWRYRAPKEIERMYRFIKCTIDVYITNLVYKDLKDIARVRVYTVERYI